MSTMCLLLFFFFFKQKSAYEMRISDWSSDVCSSDLGPPPIRRDDSVTFERPLRLEYVYEGREGDLVALAEQIYFGEELTSSKPLKLYAPSGNVSAVIAGAPVELVVDIDRKSTRLNSSH